MEYVIYIAACVIIGIASYKLTGAGIKGLLGERLYITDENSGKKTHFWIKNGISLFLLQ